jgi:hypothetical protein
MHGTSEVQNRYPKSPFTRITVRNWKDNTQWDGTLPHFRGPPAIVPRSYPTSESLLPHPTNVPRKGGENNLRNAKEDFQ